MPAPCPDSRAWESEWRRLEPLVVGSPLEALPEPRDLVRRLLGEHGCAIDDEVVHGDDRATIAEYLSAREPTRRAEAGGAELSPAEPGDAIASYRHLFDSLFDSRSAVRHELDSLPAPTRDTCGDRLAVGRRLGAPYQREGRGNVFTGH